DKPILARFSVTYVDGFRMPRGLKAEVSRRYVDKCVLPRHERKHFKRRLLPRRKVALKYTERQIKRLETPSRSGRAEHVKSGLVGRRGGKLFKERGCCTRCKHQNECGH